MTFTKNYLNELFGTVLVLSALLSAASAVDCNGKSFHCVNSTHFMICVDLGGGVSQAIDDFYIGCPPPTECQGTNHFECEYPAPTTPATTFSNVLSETTLPWEEIVTSSSLDNTTKEFSENYIDTTTAAEYSFSTDTTVSVPARTEAHVYVNNELNITEIVSATAAEITTVPIETIPQNINEDRNITESTITTEDVTTTIIETVPQATTDSIQPDTGVTGKESNITSINFIQQTTTDNVVITETVTVEATSFTTEQLIQTTTYVPIELESDYLPTELPQFIISIQNESITQNNTLLNKPSVENKKSQPVEDLAPISEKYDVAQAVGITQIVQEVETTSIVETIAESTTPSIKHLTSIADDMIITDLYHSSTKPSLVNNANTNGVDKDQSALNKLEGNELNLTSEPINRPPNDKVDNKTTQINKEDNTVKDFFSTTDGSLVVRIKENPSTLPDSEVFPEVIVTTEVPFVVIVTKENKANERDTILDGAFTTETVTNGLSYPASTGQPTTITEQSLTMDTTQNVAAENIIIPISDAVNRNKIPTDTSYESTTIITDQLITTEFPLFVSKIQNFDDTTPGGEFILDTTEYTASTEQSTTITGQNLTIEAVNRDIVPSETIYEPTTIINDITTETQYSDVTMPGEFIIDAIEYTVSTEQPTMTNEQSLTMDASQNTAVENITIPPSKAISPDIIATESIYEITSIFNDQPFTTEEPSLVSKTQDSDGTTLGGAINDNIQNTATTELPTTIGGQSLTMDTSQNVVVENITIPTSEVGNRDIIATEAIYGSTTIISDQTTATEDPSLVSKIQDTDADGTTLGEALINDTIQNTATTKQPTTMGGKSLTKDTSQNVVVENITIPTSEVVNRDIIATEAIYGSTTIISDQTTATEDPSLVSKIQDTDADGTTLGEALINDNIQNTATTELPTTIGGQSLTMDTSQNVVVENITIPTSEVVNRDIIATETIYGSTTIISDQPIVTGDPSLVSKTQDSDADGTTLGGALINDTIQNTATLPTMIGGQSLTMDTSQNVVVENITIPTSEVVNRDIIATEAIYGSTTIISDQPIVTEYPSLVSKTHNPDGTTLGGALINDTIQNTATTKQPTTMGGKSLTKDTSQNVVVENITISTSEVVNRAYQNTAAENITIPPSKAISPDIIATESIYEITLNFNDQPFTTEETSLVSKTQDSDGTMLGGALNDNIQNTATTELPTTIGGQSLTMDTSQNVVIGNINIPTSDAKNRDIIATEVIYVHTTNNNDQSIMTEAPLHLSNTQNIADTMDPALVIKTIGFGARTGQTITIDDDETGRTDTLANEVTKKIILPTTQPVPSAISNYHPLTTEASINLQYSKDTKQGVPMTTQIKDNGAITEQSTTINEESSTTDITKNIATANIKIPTRHGVDLDIIATEAAYTPTAMSNTQFIATVAPLLVTKQHNPPAKIQGFTIMTQIIDNRSATEQPTTINEDSSITKTTKNAATENIVIPSRHAVNLDIIKAEAVNTATTIRNSHLILNANENSITKKGQLLTTRAPIDEAIVDEAFTTEAVGIITSSIRLEQRLSENLLLSNAELKTDSSTSVPVIIDKGPKTVLHTTPSVQSPIINDNTIINHAIFDTYDDTKQKSNTVVLSESLGPKDKSNDISNQMFKNQQGNTKTIVVVNQVQSTTLQPSIVENNDQTDSKNVNPLDDYLIDKSNQYAEFTQQSSVYPDIQLVSQQPITTTLPTSGAVTVTQNSIRVSSIDGFLENKEVLGNKIELKPGIDTLLTLDSKIPVKEDSVNQKTDTFESGRLDVLSSETAVPSKSGIDVNTAPTAGNPTYYKQEGLHTDNINASPGYPTFGGSTSVGKSQAEVFSENNKLTTVSAFGDGNFNSLPEAIGNAHVSSQQVEQGPMDKISSPNNPIVLTPAEPSENKTSTDPQIIPISSDMRTRVTEEPVPEGVKDTFKSKKNVAVDTLDQERISAVITGVQDTSRINSEKETPHNNSAQTLKIYSSSTTRAPSQSSTSAYPSSTSTTNRTKPGPIVTAPFSCTKGVRGRFSDKDDCRKFYICLGSNHPIVGNCPENTVFSEIKKLCTKNLSHCIRQNEFKCPSAGRFSDFMNDNDYFICVNHKNHFYRFKFQCQKGYILDKTTVKCIEAKEVESNESVSISSSDTSSQTGSTASSSISSANKDSISTSSISNGSNSGDDSSTKNESSKPKTKKSKKAEETSEKSEGKEDDDDDEVFKCKKEGKFPIRNECRRYYLCKKHRSEYRRRVKRCDSDSLFHKDKRKCVDADSYEC